MKCDMVRRDAMVRDVVKRGSPLVRASALVAALLAGCATMRGDIKGAKNSWHGARYEEVVSRWGTSTRSTTLPDGRQVHTWVAEGGYGGGSPASVSVFGGSGGIGAATTVILGGGSEPQRCERTLTFKDGRVVEQTWLGQPAFCSNFRRE